MLDAKYGPYAALILRVSLGSMFLAHGLLKLLVFTPAGAAGFFESLGLPAVLAYLTIVLELVGGSALIAGVLTRWFAVALAPIPLGAALFAHAGNGWLFSNEGGGWEFPVFWTATLIVQALLGSGALALPRPSPLKALPYSD